jgi:hypothetical protein
VLTVNPKNKLFMEIPWEAVNRRNKENSIFSSSKLYNLYYNLVKVL